MFSMIYATYPQAEEAKQAAGMLLKHKLAACVNIIPAVLSLYEWEGAMQEATEVLMLAKTSSEAAEEAVKLLRAYHTYDTPCITLIPLAGGDDDYLNWIKNSVFTKKSG